TITGACMYQDTPGAPCDDHNACTINDRCGTVNPPLGCFGDGCTVIGCAGTPTPGVPCNDGNACTTGETCSPGAAGVSGPRAGCDDGNPCTADACGAPGGCVHTPTAGAPCDDGNACTRNDTCNTLGACVGGPPLHCDDGNACTADSCNPA